MPLRIDEEPKVLNCPKCGAQLGRGALGCGYCGSEFVQAVGVEAQKPVSQVVEKDGRKVVGEISFNLWGGLNDSSLAVVAAQIADQTPKVLALKPQGQRAYTSFTLPLPPKAGRPEALLAEVFKRDDAGFDVCLSTGFPSDIHQWAREEGRVLRLPENV